MRNRLFEEHELGEARPLRIPTDEGLALFVFVAGTPFVMGLFIMIVTYSSLAGPLFLTIAWVTGGHIGLKIGAVRRGAAGVFIGGIQVAFLAVLLLLVAAMLGTVNLSLHLIGAAAFIGPLLIGLWNRQRSRRLLGAKRWPVPVVLTAAHGPSPALPYPVPPEAQSYWEGRARSKAGRGGGGA
jgi:hypothetical protein